MANKIDFSATVGDEYLVLHEGNHNKDNDPHTQYLLKSNIVILTQAQYDALPASKNTDGKLYFIKA